MWPRSSKACGPHRPRRERRGTTPTGRSAGRALPGLVGHSVRSPSRTCRLHGPGGNAYGWSPAVAEPGLRGHRAVAVDLPGHGPGAHFPLSYQSPQDLERLRQESSPLAGTTLADFAPHVASVVRRAHRNGPVVLAGQSLGGVTLNAAADYSDNEVRAMLNILEPDESAAIGARDGGGLPHEWGRIPRTFVRFAEDRTLPPALQDLMIREADEPTPDNPFRVRSLTAPHIGPRHPALLADELEQVARLCP
ncbi:alpha/beta fold hydrolase [Streptomyces sp. NPDC085524]|uniref:alpha/beta fold hydrolase n=1 Tax=unclassified Streptomyces TaxID=2593676 RepID=UPI0035E1545E